MQYKGYIEREEAIQCHKEEQSGRYRWQVAISHNVSESTLIRAYKRYGIQYNKHKKHKKG